jgi:Plastocyanin
MRHTRRRLLETTGTVLATAALAGCNGATEQAASGDGASTIGADLGVVAEWNAIRTRLRDPVILGHAEEYAAGASVVGDIFERFERVSGENNAHERLEDTAEEHYEGFETALSDLQSTLENDDLDGAHDAMRDADKHLRGAQTQLTSEETVKQLTALVMGVHIKDVDVLLATDALGDATVEYNQIATKFQEKGLYDMIADADTEAADSVVDALDRAATAAEAGEKSKASDAGAEAFGAATQGLHAVASANVAGAAHMAALQGLGWDAAALSTIGGPGTDYAHAAALNLYRARVYDAHWVAANGHSDTAATMASDVFAHFEGARAHEALEDADRDAYERFESGLESLQTGINEADDSGIDDAVATIDENLRTGIDILAGGNAPLLQSGFFRARFEDAYERYQQDEAGAAATIAEGLFGRFEANELDFHETLEDTSESLYETFEEEHLSALITAYENDDTEAVDTHHQGVLDALLDFEAEHSAALAGGAEAGYMSARGFDAAGVAALGDADRASTILSDAFAHFEAGAAGYHEAIEAADAERYESFEAALGAVQTAADDGGDVYAEAKPFNDEAVASAYAIAEAGGASEPAAAMMSDAFAHFEQAEVHEMLEAADDDTYEGFESALESYQSGLESGSSDGSERYAAMARTGGFAVAGAVDAAPAVDAAAAGGEKDSEETAYEGGPNIVEGVPDDADHVVEAQAVVFEPAELTVQQGETVAWKYVAGDAHNVIASEDGIPDDAEYWASGGFDSEAAAREGWENGKGALHRSGQVYVHTFEATGTHEYLCVPHEAAGMVGKIIVE